MVHPNENGCPFMNINYSKYNSHTLNKKLIHVNNYKTEYCIYCALLGT